MPGKSENNNWEFLLNYKVVDGFIGGVCLNLSLLVSSSIASVKGVGHITQATAPSLNISLNLSGAYSFVNDKHTLLVLKGKDSSPLTLQDASRPQESFVIKIYLEKDWKTGIANYEYFKNGRWYSLEEQEVELISKIDDSMDDMGKIIFEKKKIKIPV